MRGQYLIRYTVCMPWKTVQNKNKVKKRTKLAILFLGLILILIIVGNLVKLTQTLFSPWKLPHQSEKNYIWDGEFNLNLVIRKDPSVFILVFNPKDEKAILINIPDQTLVGLPSGFGEWQIHSVYDLGETNKKGSGALLLEETVTALLGIPIEGFLDIEGLKEVKDGDELIAKFGKNLFGGFMLIPSIKTDLTLWELIRLKMGLSTVRFDKVENVDLSQALQKSNLPDGTEVFIPDLIRIDGVIAPYVSDPAIKLEHKSIAVFNAADVPGIAQSAARMVTNLGGNAIITANHTKKIPRTQVTGEASQTLKRLIQIFEKCDKGCDRIDPGDEDLVSSRAQINIILGEDFVVNR